MALIDGMMVAVALPVIARVLRVSAANAILVVSAYQLATAALILPTSALSARLGLKRVYVAAVALLGLGSFACAFAPTLPALIAARVVQGAGGAGITALTNALLRRVYPAERLAGALAVNAAVAAVALSAGPSLAALMLSLLSWRWLFLVNLPVAGFALFAGLRWLGDDQQPARSASLGGMLLSVAAGASVVLALNLMAQGAALGWTAAGALAAAGAWIAFVAHQRRATRPLLLTSPLRTLALRSSIVVYFLAAFAQTSAYLAIPFLLRGEGYGPAQIGLMFTAWPIAVLAMGRLSARLCGRYPRGVLSAAGLAAMGAGLLGVALAAGASRALAVGLIALGGLGYGFYQIPNTQMLVTSVPMAQAADATAMGALSRAIGQASGAAGVALCLRLLGERGPELALALAAALAVLAAYVSLRRP